MLSHSFSAKALCVGCVFGCAAGSALAGVTFFNTNQQYTNVNIVADQSAPVIQAEVGNTGVAVFFDGSGSILHGQHGVAFVEPANPNVPLFTLAVIIDAGWDFLSMDWKLDAVPPNDGLVSFFAYDSLNNLIPLSAGTNTFAFGHNGQNPFHLHADGGTPVHSLVISSTVPIADIKQVSMDIIPAPGAMGLLAASALVVGRRRR